MPAAEAPKAGVCAEVLARSYPSLPFGLLKRAIWPLRSDQLRLAGLPLRVQAVWKYLNRVQSSRRLEREAGRNLEVMWLTGRLVPDHKTIADFRKDNGPAIKKVCAQFVALCRKMGQRRKSSGAALWSALTPRADIERPRSKLRGPAPRARTRRAPPASPMSFQKWMNWAQRAVTSPAIDQ